MRRPGYEIPLPGLPTPRARWRCRRWCSASSSACSWSRAPRPVAFAPDDEALLTVVATMVASAVEIDWAHERAAGDVARR